jgi:signal peptidase II
MDAPRHHRGAVLLAIAIVIALDQVSKHWALHALADGPIDLVGSLRLRLTFNDSAAFSLGGGRTSLIAVIASVVVVALIVAAWRATDLGTAVGLAIIAGGALGNLTDRALRNGDGVLGGRVVDFIDPQWWPVFNVADVSLWVGIAVLVLSSWGRPVDEPTEEAVS